MSKPTQKLRTYRVTVYRRDWQKYCGLVCCSDDKITIEFQCYTDTTPELKPLEEMKEDETLSQ